MSVYRYCPWCGRSIAPETFDRATAHAPGCKTRRSLLAKASAQKKRDKELAKAARKAARALRQKAS